MDGSGNNFLPQKIFWDYQKAKDGARSFELLATIGITCKQIVHCSTSSMSIPFVYSWKNYFLLLKRRTTNTTWPEDVPLGSVPKLHQLIKESYNLHPGLIQLPPLDSSKLNKEYCLLRVIINNMMT